jgi:hypothetical protein
MLTVIILSVIMLNAVTLNVVTLSVVAPMKCLTSFRYRGRLLALPTNIRLDLKSNVGHSSLLEAHLYKFL